MGKEIEGQMVTRRTFIIAMLGAAITSLAVGTAIGSLVFPKVTEIPVTAGTVTEMKTVTVPTTGTTTVTVPITETKTITTAAKTETTTVTAKGVTTTKTVTAVGD